MLKNIEFLAKKYPDAKVRWLDEVTGKLAD